MAESEINLSNIVPTDTKDAVETLGTADLQDGKPMDFEDAKSQLRTIFANLESQESKELVVWASEYLENTEEVNEESIRHRKRMTKLRQKQTRRLESIANHLREQGVLRPGREREKLVFPTEGINGDCTVDNTINIDYFLYEDDDVNDLVKENVISRNYCNDCKSRNTTPFNFISHSLSKQEIEYIFTKLMPEDTQNVLDIGSHVGAVVYGSSIFSNGNVKTVGVEMNSELVQITRNIIRQFNLKNLEIIEDDIRNLPQVVKNAQFIVMNNVFQFFLSDSEQIDCWEFLFKTMRPGTVLVHHPAIKTVTSHLKLTFKIDDWLEMVDTTLECIDFCDKDEDLFEDVITNVKYIVKKTAFNSE